MTTSLGSNCYGSLLIAIIQTLKAIANQARENSANDGNLVMTLIFCCIQCILSMIQDILEYFNKYAFAQVAIYGKDYCTAAKDTWELAKSRGIDALVNDNLIGNVLGFGGFFIGLLTAGCGALVVYFQSSLTASDADTYMIVCALIGFFIGLVEFSVLAGVIDSGVTTTFVCLAEDPAALQKTKPNLYNKIHEVYPQVMLGF
ncbi:choline transporter-like protein [Globomyces pollinis-pini]|nr:choline transporter-like protein [Globomyces pollinis-pini]